MFLHGAGGLVEESPFLAALARRWHVFAPLWPGYGDSEGGDTLPVLAGQERVMCAAGGFDPSESFVLLMMLPLAGGEADGSWGSPQTVRLFLAFRQG